MFARVATFHGAPNRVPEGRRIVDELSPEMQQLEGFQHSYLLVDSKSGKVLAVTFWDNEEAARRGPDPSVRDRVMQALGTRETPTVETYEVGRQAGGETTRSRFARVSEYCGFPSRIEDGIRTAQDTEPDLKAVQGFQHAYLLVDRKSGKAITITIWDSENALTRSSSGVNPIRDSIARSLGDFDGPTVEVFDIAGKITQRVRAAA